MSKGSGLIITNTILRLYRRRKNRLTLENMRKCLILAKMTGVKLCEMRDLSVKMTNQNPYCGGYYIQYCFKDNHLDQFAKIHV